MFRTNLLSKEFKPKLIKVVSGNLEDIKYMFDEDVGNIDSVMLPEWPSQRSGITLADVHDLEMNETQIFG